MASAPLCQPLMNLGLPLVALYHDQRWLHVSSMSTSAGGAHPVVVLVVPQPHGRTDLLHTVLLWLVQAAVWGLATLALTGYTGLIRRTA